MHADSLNFLKELVNAPGPSGYEEPVQRVFRDYVTKFADRVTTDVMGSVTAVVNESAELKVMLAGHADEIGFQVRFISEEGFLYFGQIGGHDAIVAVGQRVYVHTATGPVLGVLGRKAVHLLEAAEREKAPKTDDLWIDIGAANKKEAQEVVEIGDCVTYAQDFQMLRGDRVIARSFDNKMGCFIVAETLRLLKGKTLQCGVYAVANVQEEIGLRGARTSSYNINPQVGIATDVGHSMDFPGADKKRVGDIKIGGGPKVARGANINPKVFSIIIEAAKANDIPYQITAASGATGTDANAMQISRSGMATGLISVPLRYMHTPGEVMSLSDIENTARLMAAFVERVTPEVNWIP